MALTKREILIAYLLTLRKGCEPLYEYQKPQVKMELEYWKKKMNDVKGFETLNDLSDKDLIVRFKIKPSIVNLKYIGINLEKMQESLKTDFEHKLEIAEKQLNDI